MQLTPAQRRFYIDPVQDPTVTTDRVLVTEERVNRGTLLDTIVTVKKDRYFTDNRHWWITEDGYHVHGAPTLPANVSPGRLLIAPGGDGWFWLGSPGRHSGDRYILANVRRSDGKQLPGRGATGNTSMEFPDVALAAPWAEELFPAPGDSDAVILAKLALAEQRWNHRRAKAEIIRQGMGRGWDDDLSSLRDDGKLPAATFGLYYRGAALIEASQAPVLSAYERNRLDELQGRDEQARTQVRTLVGVNVNVPLRLNSITTHDNIRNLPTMQLRDALRNAVGDYSAVPGDYTLTPVLRSIAS